MKQHLTVSERQLAPRPHEGEKLGRRRPLQKRMVPQEHRLIERLQFRVGQGHRRQVGRAAAALPAGGGQQQPEQSLREQNVVGHHRHEVGRLDAQADPGGWVRPRYFELT